MTTYTRGGSFGTAIDIDPYNDLAVTPMEREEMGREALTAYIDHANAFLDDFHATAISTGDILVPVTTPEGVREWGCDAMEEFREHLDAWDPSNLVYKWVERSQRPLKLSVWWERGAMTLYRDTKEDREVAVGLFHDVEFPPEDLEFHTFGDFLETPHCLAIWKELRNVPVLFSEEFRHIPELGVSEFGMEAI